MENSGGMGAASMKNSQKSKFSYKSELSRMSRKSKMSAANGNRGSNFTNAGPGSPIAEQDYDDDSELEAKPEDFVSCNTCIRNLTDDEKIINARFVNEAMVASRDISVFPICIACNFENL